MAQINLPNQDITATGFTPSSGTDHYAVIDENTSTPNEADFSTCGSASGVLEVKFPAFADPLSSTGYEIRVWAKSATGGVAETLEISWIEGTTVRSASAFLPIASTAALYTLSPSGAEIDSMSNHGDFRARLTSGPGLGKGEEVIVYAVDMRMPDAPTGSRGKGWLRIVMGLCGN